MNKGSLLTCLACGPLLTVFFILGFILLVGWVPPPSPTLDAEAVAQIYQTNTTRLRVGFAITMVSMSLILPWGIGIAAITRRIETQKPALAYTQVASSAIATMIVVLGTVCWQLASFRPDEVQAEFVRLLHDMGWFLLLLPWPPFTIWCVAIALSIFNDKNQPRILPRWIAYLSVWAGILFIPAGMVVFFKTGPFAWDGLLAFYVPVVAFFIWVIALTVEGVRAVNREAHQDKDSALDQERRV